MRAFAAAVLLALTTSACMTAGMMEQESLTASPPVLYAATPDSLLSAARAVLGEQRFELLADGRPDTATQMLVGSKSMSLFSGGEFARFVITATAPDTSVVRVLSRSAFILDLGHRNRARSLLLALDAHLDPTALLVPGTRIRFGAGGGGRGEGVGDLRGWRHDSLVVQLQGGSATAVALGDLTRVGVLRGEYRHVREGAGIGAGLGLLVGLLLAQSVPEDEWLADAERATRMMGGLVVGALVGALLGSQVRTSVWSDVDVARLRP